jgi:hypothetical protein
LESLLILFKDDDYVKNLLYIDFDNDNSRYNYLHNLKDFFDLYLEDNLQQKILSFFDKNIEYTSQMWHGIIESLKTEKRQNAIKTQLKINIPEIIDDKFVANIISQIILSKLNQLHNIRKSINKELKNYVNIDGSELNSKNIKLKAYISKNKASFFAKASA